MSTAKTKVEAEKISVTLKAKDKALLEELAKELKVKPETVLSKALLSLSRTLANDKLVTWQE